MRNTWVTVAIRRPRAKSRVRCIAYLAQDTSLTTSLNTCLRPSRPYPAGGTNRTVTLRHEVSTKNRWTLGRGRRSTCIANQSTFGLALTVLLYWFRRQYTRPVRASGFCVLQSPSRPDEALVLRSVGLCAGPEAVTEDRFRWPRRQEVVVTLVVFNLEVRQSRADR